MTSPSAEPISVRVAIQKGCTPKRTRNGDWDCPGCGDDGYGEGEEAIYSHTGRNHGLMNMLVRDGYESWLTPAASMVLLAELVDAEVVSLWKGNPPFCVRVGEYDGPTELSIADTLPEAIAMAWLSWRESQAQP